jgi:hypothetical protein
MLGLVVPVPVCLWFRAGLAFALYTLICNESGGWVGLAWDGMVDGSPQGLYMRVVSRAEDFALHQSSMTSGQFGLFPVILTS